ncbi:gliding motility lipoprotein GldB [Aquiflexum sp. LQ15W]|uniref:gliding motility lipoprotein GldB n=1 Tax=Cognataquiflexum nitidum TaxID=2922272 RepID=UPI001F148A85|nr:gliding motility lipoprotein GldB [Cognataquiflexum nitidum]MCH6199807.1 gliding motility lipoprotein GldB [Cognataquiflexum nitidum]
MKNQILFSAILSLVIIFSSCKKETEHCHLDEDILNTDLELKIVRLENDFFSAKTPDEFTYLFENHSYFAEKYLLTSNYPFKEDLAADLLATHQDTLMRELYDEVMIHYPDVTGLEKDLSDAFKYIKHYFPEFKVPKVYTFVSGFSSDLYIDEEMVVIGLDYFLPSDHRFQVPDLPEYIAKRYEAKYIVPMIVTAISSVYNKTDLKQNSLVAEMIYYGKAYHFTKAILPCTPDEFIIGYSSEEVAACFDNEVLIWSYFVENDLLFETNPFEIRKYTGEAPSTVEISPDAPGRVGRWLGWNIVDDYQFNKDVPLWELMEESDTEKIFKLSGYKPRP